MVYYGLIIPYICKVVGVAYAATAGNSKSPSQHNFLRHQKLLG